nr:retinoid-binding protein 7 isoform X2 [Syngnathus scovelli]
MSEMAVNYTGTWDMVSNVNFEGYMIALGVDFATRKVAALLKPQKVINQEGNHFNIRTLTTFRNYEIAFKVGVEYKEETKGMDNRICQVEYILQCQPFKSVPAASLTYLVIPLTGKYTHAQNLKQQFPERNKVIPSHILDTSFGPHLGHSKINLPSK